MHERRQFLRVLFDRPAYLNHGEQSWSCQLLDLSLQGALVTLPNDWDEELTQLTLTFSLSDVAVEELSITMDVEVKHTRNQQIGLRCLHIDIESASHLKRLIELNLGDDDLLHRELEHLVDQQQEAD
ncbi:PilZ domain-containing protein [Agarivorans litoreus]|uniref:PilZ domain-containing protein n=1 Tax=Agarivorans litoreus TaxID=1510455 RepID=UPI001C7D220B|nr:PilZ domain-containing protein [Agarivorans litoreus]